MPADLFYTKQSKACKSYWHWQGRAHTTTDMASLKKELSRAPDLAPSPIGNMGQERERKQMREDTQ